MALGLVVEFGLNWRVWGYCRNYKSCKRPMKSSKNTGKHFSRERVKMEKVKRKDLSRGEEYAAKLLILDGENMTPHGKRDIANWLRRQARFLEGHGHEFAKKFTARYMYR